MSAATGSMILQPPDMRWLALALLTVATAQLTLRMPTLPVSFSISDIFTFSGALLFGPSAGAVLAGIDAAVLSSRLGQNERSLMRLLFNIAAAVLAMLLSSALFFLITGTPPLHANPGSIVDHVVPLAAFAAAYFLLNTGLVAVAVALTSRRALLRVWREHFLGLWPGYVGGAFAAGLGLFLISAQHKDLRVLAFVLPIPFVLYITFRTSVARMYDEVSHLTRINSMYLATIESLAQAVDARDDVTHNHLRRVQTNTMRLARELGVDDPLELRALEAAALLHDVGKLGIPEHILNKPDKLTAAEFEIMKLHARIGADILSPIGFPFPVVPIVRHHHENWDGSGYPDGLRGEQIPVGARILAVVDCFDALTSDRPYRKAFSPEKALAIIEERSGGMYDPRVVAAFRAVEHEAAAELHTTPSAAAAADTMAQVRQAVRAEEPEEAAIGAAVHIAGRLGEIVGRGLDLRRTCEAIEAELSQRTGRNTLVLYQYDAHLNALFARAAGGTHRTAVEGLRIGLGLRLTGWVGANRSTIANSEAALDLGNIASQLRPQPQLCMSTPMVEGGQLVGVLTVYSYSATPFSAVDVTLFEMLASMLGTRLDHELAAGAFETRTAAS